MTNKMVKERFLSVVEQCDTMREAAKLLGCTEQYAYLLTRKLGVTKWRQKNRVHKEIKTEKKICEECNEMFYREVLNQSPGRFCNNKCQGRYLGRNHGFKKSISV